MNCNQHLLVTAPLIEGEPKLTFTREPAILHLYTGTMMRDLTVEQYHTVYAEWKESALTRPGREVSTKVSYDHLGRRMDYASKFPPLLLPSK